MTCKYCKDEICINADSPACADYCPCRDYVELCKFAKGIDYCEKCIHYDLCLYNAYQHAYSVRNYSPPVSVKIRSDKCVNFFDKANFIRPPCKINAHIFVIPTKENRLEEITEMKVKGFAIGEPCNVANCFRVRGTSALFQPSFEEFGKTAFLTCEEAERALKEVKDVK